MNQQNWEIVTTLKHLVSCFLFPQTISRAMLRCHVHMRHRRGYLGSRFRRDMFGLVSYVYFDLLWLLVEFQFREQRIVHMQLVSASIQSTYHREHKVRRTPRLGSANCVAPLPFPLLLPLIFFATSKYSHCSVGNPMP